jgi:hypothetical protein
VLPKNVRLATFSSYSTGKWVNCQVFFLCGSLFYGEECSSPSYTMPRSCRQNQGESGSRTSNRTAKVIIQYRPKNYEIEGRSVNAFRFAVVYVGGVRFSLWRWEKGSEGDIGSETHASAGHIWQRMTAAVVLPVQLCHHRAFMPS